MSSIPEPEMKLPPGWRPGEKIPGSHAQWRGFKMPGMTWATLRRKWSLIPLFVSVGFGVIGSACYLTRLALLNPDVTWREQKKKPWERIEPTYQYKFYSPTIDYSKLKAPPERPDI